MRRLILASGSRYRKELLERLRLPFEAISPDVDESPAPGESPAATALRLALEKAQALAARHADALIIGSDQVATHGGHQVGKPGSFDKALAQLQAMRGQTVEFHTALCLLDASDGSFQREDVVVRVRFRDLPDEELAAYLRLEEPYDCAGSAKSEGLGIALLESMEAPDPTALVGLPLIALSGMLRRKGVSPFGAGQPA
jgi:septum formation protein